MDDRYAELLRRGVEDGDVSTLLAEARSLGEELDEQGVPRAALEEIHAAALRRVAEACPDAPLRAVAPVVVDLVLEIGRSFEAARRRRGLENGGREDGAGGLADGDFLALLTHELRTPLSPILTWSELLRADAMDRSQVANAVASIERSGRALQAMIDDLAVAARTAAGRLRYDPGRVDFAPILSDVVDGFRAESAARGLRLVAKVEPSLPVRAESRWLRQIARNLIGNAVKFTPRDGRIDVDGRRAGKRVRLTVADTGCGLGPTELGRIFDRAWPVSTDLTRRHRGLGLGLAVVRRLVELQGGTVVAESAGQGQGASFTVELPAATPSRGATKDEPRAHPGGDLAGARILVVDDDPHATRAASALLSHWGADVRTVGSADEALAAIADFAPSVILSDLAMPRHDGYALVVAIRDGEAARGAARLPAIALTAHSREEERRKAIGAGFDAVVSKPIEKGELLETIGLLLAVERRA